jgi:hypothetical protein
LEGGYDGQPHEAVRRLEEKERKVNKGKSSLAHAANGLSAPFSGPAKWVGNAVGMYDRDPRSDRRYVKQVNKHRALSEGAAAFYLSHRAKMSPALDNVLRRLASMGAGYDMSEEEFEANLKDILDDFRQKEENQNAPARSAIDAFEANVLKINKALLENIGDDLEAKKAIDLYRMLVVASLLIPFVAPGLAILPGLSSFLNPFMNMDMANAFGEIAASDHTGVFGQIGSAIHLDDMISGFLDHFPGIAQLLDFISSILQSGLVQDVAGVISPVLNSPLPDIALGVAFALARVKPELDRYEKISKQIKDAREQLKSSHAHIADSLDKHAVESSYVMAKHLISAIQRAAKRSMVASLLETLVSRIPAGGDHTTQEAKDVIKLVKSIYEKESDAINILKVMGFSFEKNPTDPTKMICNGFSSLGKKRTIDNLQQKLRDGDVSQMSALVHMLDRQIIEEHLNSLKPLGASPTAEEEKQREVEISQYHSDLHKFDDVGAPGARNMLEKRAIFVSGLNSTKLQALATGLESKPEDRKFAAQSGEEFLNYAVMQKMAEERWEIDSINFSKDRTMKEAYNNLYERVYRSESGVLSRGAKNTHNILAAPSYSPAPASGAAVSPPPAPTIPVGAP